MSASDRSTLVPVGAHAVVIGRKHSVLPALVEQAGGAARFAWDEFFYAEHHNPYTQRAYQRAVRRFLAWCEGERTALPQIIRIKVTE